MLVISPSSGTHLNCRLEKPLHFQDCKKNFSIIWLRAYVIIVKVIKYHLLNAYHLQSTVFIKHYVSNSHSNLELRPLFTETEDLSDRIQNAQLSMTLMPACPTEFPQGPHFSFQTFSSVFFLEFITPFLASLSFLSIMNPIELTPGYPLKSPGKL